MFLVCYLTDMTVAAESGVQQPSTFQISINFMTH